MKTNRSLWNILSGHFIISSTIPFILFATLVYIYTVTHFRDAIDARNNSSAKLMVSIVEEKMRGIQLTLQKCLTKIEESPKALAQINNYLQAITIASQSIHQVRLLDKQGIVYAQAPYSKDDLGLDMSNYPSFKNAGLNMEPYWSPSIISEAHRTPVFQISIPFSKGVLIADVTFPNLNSLLKEINLGNKSILAITDQTGTYIAHSDERRVQQRNEDPHFNLFKNLPDTEVQKRSLNNDSRYSTVYATSIGPSRWVVLIYQNSMDVYRNLITYTIAFTTIALVILFMAMFILMLRFKTITSHFNELLNLAAKFSRGDYSHSETRKDIKEFTEIATAFEYMAESIQAREKQIHALNRDLAQKLNQITKLHNMNEMVLSSAAEAIFGLDPDGNIIFINAAACKMLGYNKEELIGHNHHDLCHFSRENGEPYPFEECPLHSSINTGTANRGNITFIRKDGFFIPVDFYSMPVLEEGKMQGIVVSAIDISERLESEREMQKLRSLLSNIINSMPSVLIAVDSSTKVIQWNSQAEIETGLTRENAIDLPLGKVYPKLAPKMTEIHATIAGSSKGGSKGRLTHRRAGRTYYEDITIYPLEHSGIKGAVIRLDDVTDKVNMEQIMVQSEKMMSLGGLAAGMAHEINNPLAGISGNVYNINKRLFGDLPANKAAAEQYGLSLKDIRGYLESRDIPKMIHSIKSSTLRASTIVRNMLSFSRKSEMSLELYDITQLLDETIDIAANDYDFKREFDFKKIKIIREYENNLPKVYCERGEIQQVFFNLLKNGAEAMKDKLQPCPTPSFILRVFEEKHYVTIQIEDNGPGMDEDISSRIFEPFYTTKPVGKGTGLGLSVSYFIITEQHGGTMTIDSKPGHWSRFTIKLPLIQKTDTD